MDFNHEVYKNHPVYLKLVASGPKRILSLDLEQNTRSLVFLEAIEKILVDRFNDPKFVLSDYFDLVGGLGTSAVLATFIALGKSISEIKEILLEVDSKKHTEELFKHPDLQNISLGSEKFKMGLAIFSKSEDLLGLDVFHNHPTNQNYKYNSKVHIIELLKFSLEGFYMNSKTLKFNKKESAIFLDSDINTSNNLSELLFIMCTSKHYEFEWRASKYHLLMIAIGMDVRSITTQPLAYYSYNPTQINPKTSEKEKDKTSKTPNEVSFKHFPKAFDFGVKNQTSQPISQEELKKKFTSIFNRKGKVYKKSQCVFAKKADGDIEITTITSDGVETKNTAKKGDYIVKNKTESEEQYVIKKENFDKRYTLKNEQTDHSWAEYTPMGEVIGLQLTEAILETVNLEKHFYLMASWGQAQYCSIGDYIVNPVHEEGYYRIGFKEFQETYTLKV